MIVLTHCEICGSRMTPHEQHEHKVECKECRDHMDDMIKKAIAAWPDPEE